MSISRGLTLVALMLPVLFVALPARDSEAAAGPQPGHHEDDVPLLWRGELGGHRAARMRVAAFSPWRIDWSMSM